MTSLFDLFRIGIGPSSSHTVGPMRAARGFLEQLEAGGVLALTARVVTELHGSLALTGRGHGTDRAIVLGLSGERPEEVDSGAIDTMLDRIARSGRLALLGGREIAFVASDDLLWFPAALPGHPNGMRFRAFDAAGGVLGERTCYSIGGGFVRDGADGEGLAEREVAVPFPFRSSAELLDMSEAAGLPIWRLMLANECARRPEPEVRDGIARIWAAMSGCLERGLVTEGILPGGLAVQRRAPSRYQELKDRPTTDPLEIIDWVGLFAIAVNEENAAGGRVVTAPTNGAAGVIPAVAAYYVRFHHGDAAGLERYFLAAAAIGALYRRNASISGAEVGCQGEVGVACSMAAAGLASAWNAGNPQVEHAAEIGMEHHLGMTCDPVAGLVQIPCIERNAFGAVSAIHAARMAMRDTGTHKVTLDQVIRTMYQTGLDMQTRYKETSLGGLAVNVIEC